MLDFELSLNPHDNHKMIFSLTLHSESIRMTNRSIFGIRCISLVANSSFYRANF